MPDKEKFIAEMQTIEHEANRALVRSTEASLTDRQRAAVKMNESVRAALDYIKKNPRCPGKNIVKAIGLTSLEHFRRSIVPTLKKLGVRNDGDGYHLPGSDQST